MLVPAQTTAVPLIVAIGGAVTVIVEGLDTAEQPLLLVTVTV